MLETFAIGVGLNLGSALLGSLFGGGNRKPWTQREINKLETFDQPQSRYGEPIPEFYGRVRVQGIYVAAQVPFDWERDDYRNGETREVELTYIYYGNLGVMWGIAPLQQNINIQKIYFNKQVYIAGGQIDGILGQYWGRFEGLSTSDYSGGQTTPDPKLSFLGENHTAFRGTMYTAMKRLRLNNSDGGLFEFRYPNLEAEIVTHDQGASLTLADVVASLMSKAGYAQSEYDVTELASIECRGFVATVDTLANKLGKLQSAYFFEIVDTGAQLKFIKAFRSSSSAYIPATDLGTSDGDRQDDLFTETEEDLASLPTSFRVSFNDYGDSFQPNVKESFKIQVGDWENIEEIETGLTLTESEGYTIANRLLLLSWTRRKSYKFNLSPKYQRLEAGDVIDVELRGDGSATQVQIKRLNQSPSGVIEVEAIGYDGSIFGLGYTAPADKVNTATATQGTAINLGQTNIYAVNSVTDSTGSITYVEGVDYTVNTSTGTITPIIGGGITNGSDVVVIWQGEAEETPAPDLNPIPTTLTAIDIVKPTDNDFAGIYLFADGDNPWQSATLWVSNDGTNYNSAGPIYRGIFGTANTILPDGSGEDLVSTLSVTVTETMTFPASGRLLVGAEILDYANAVLDSSTATSKTYILSQFQRALRNTDGTGHGSSEAVYLLSGYKFVSPITVADIGTTRYFKAVSPGQALNDVSAVSIVIEGNSIPLEITGFSPTQGDIGDSITIYGFKFTGAISAAINGVAITSFMVVNDSTITGIIDTGTTTGKVTVTNSTGTGTSLTDFAIVDLITNWGDIGGIPSNQLDLWDYLKRSWRYSYTTEIVTIPPPGGTITVNVTDTSYLVPSAGQPITLKSGADYCQFELLTISGSTITLRRNADGRASGTTIQSNAYVSPGWEMRDIYGLDTFLEGDFSGKMDKSVYDSNGDGIVDVAASVEGVNAAGNSKYYGTNETGTAGFYDLPTSAVWGNITGTIANQIDLQSALDSKFDTPTGTTEQYLTGDGSLATFPSLTVEKTHTTHSLLSNGLVTITLQSEYFHFVDPINYDGTVYLPAVTANDYFECEIINSGDGSKRVIIVENDDTHIITLGGGYLGTLYRSVYIYWDGTIWRVWIRGSY